MPLSLFLTCFMSSTLRFISVMSPGMKLKMYYVAVEVSSSSCSELLFAHYVRVCLLAHVSVFHPVMIVKEIYGCHCYRIKLLLHAL